MNVIVIWCDSPKMILSTPADENDIPVVFDSQQLTDIPFDLDTAEIFDILRRKDSTKVAIPTTKVEAILGWDYDFASADSDQVQPAPS